MTPDQLHDGILEHVPHEDDCPTRRTRGNAECWCYRAHLLLGVQRYRQCVEALKELLHSPHAKQNAVLDRARKALTEATQP